MKTQTIRLGADKQADIAFDEYGKASSDQTFVVLHGGAGTQSVTGLAQSLSDRAHVYVPTHPGFGGTTRPDWLNSVRSLAESYLAFVEQLDLRNVTVIGNSVGGWIAAEMALLHNARIHGYVLIDAGGIVVEGQPNIDVFQLTPEELSKRSYHNPDAFRIDPTKLTDAQKAIFAANRQALALYGGNATLTDPTLLGRLGGISAPTLVLWGDSDSVYTPDYGRAYAAAIPTARFELLPETGHLPQIETPDQVVAAIWEFVRLRQI